MSFTASTVKLGGFSNGFFNVTGGADATVTTWIKAGGNSGGDVGTRGEIRVSGAGSRVGQAPRA